MREFRINERVDVKNGRKWDRVLIEANVSRKNTFRIRFNNGTTKNKSVTSMRKAVLVPGFNVAEAKKKYFGKKVLVYWDGDKQWYPAKIVRVLDIGEVEVEYDDGENRMFTFLDMSLEDEPPSLGDLVWHISNASKNRNQRPGVKAFSNSSSAPEELRSNGQTALPKQGMPLESSSSTLTTRSLDDKATQEKNKTSGNHVEHDSSDKLSKNKKLIPQDDGGSGKDVIETGDDYSPPRPRPPSLKRKDIKKGLRVEVWWGGDSLWYPGKVVKSPGSDGKFKIIYDDGPKIIEEPITNDRGDLVVRLEKTMCSSFAEDSSDDDDEDIPILACTPPRPQPRKKKRPIPRLKAPPKLQIAPRFETLKGIKVNQDAENKKKMRRKIPKKSSAKSSSSSFGPISSTSESNEGKQNSRPGRLSTSTKDIKDPRRKSKDHVASPKESELFAFKSKHYRSLNSDSVQSSSKKQKLNSDSGQSSSKRQKPTSRSASEIVSRKSGKKEPRGHSIEWSFHRPLPLREARPLSKDGVLDPRSWRGGMETVDTPATWECKICGFDNQNAGACMMCGTARDDDVSSAWKKRTLVHCVELGIIEKKINGKGGLSWWCKMCEKNIMNKDSDEVLDHFSIHCDVTSAVEHGDGESTEDGTKADFKCVACEINLPKNNAVDHIKGARHAKNVKRHKVRLTLAQQRV